MKKQDYPLKIKFKCWIETQDNISILGEGKWQLLKMIQEKGSLKAAVEQMGYSYRQTWENLKIIEEKLGFKLIKRMRGGAHGGETVLTPEGEKIVSFFDHLQLETHKHLSMVFDQLMDELNQIPLLDKKENS